MKNSVHRFLAFVIDYTIILLYGLVLFGLTMMSSSTFEVSMEQSPLASQIIGFFTMTIPVFFYFYLTEKGRNKATIGKKMQKLVVQTDGANRSYNILVRNLIKFIPWEIAHTGVHWMKYYERHDMSNPVWVWVLLILPQVVVIIYIISIIRSKGKSSIYDKIAKTEVEYVPQMFKLG